MPCQLPLLDTFYRKKKELTPKQSAVALGDFWECVVARLVGAYRYCDAGNTQPDLLQPKRKGRAKSYLEVKSSKLGSTFKLYHRQIERHVTWQKEHVAPFLYAFVIHNYQRPELPLWENILQSAASTVRGVVIVPVDTLVAYLKEHGIQPRKEYSWSKQNPQLGHYIPLKAKDILNASNFQHFKSVRDVPRYRDILIPPIGIADWRNGGRNRQD